MSVRYSEYSNYWIKTWCVITCYRYIRKKEFYIFVCFYISFTFIKFTLTLVKQKMTMNFIFERFLNAKFLID